MYALIIMYISVIIVCPDYYQGHYCMPRILCISGLLLYAQIIMYIWVIFFQTSHSIGISHLKLVDIVQRLHFFVCVFMDHNHIIEAFACVSGVLIRE